MASDTLTALMKMKALKEEKEQGKIIVSVGKGNDKASFEVSRLSNDKVISILENSVMQNQKDWQINRSLVYAAIPELHDKELLEEYDCLKNPESIVDVFFTRGDYITLGRELAKSINAQISVKN